MGRNKFWNLLTSAIDLPFSIDDVAEIEANCGTVYIELENGSVYCLNIAECEPSTDLTTV